MDNVNWGWHPFQQWGWTLSDYIFTSYLNIQVAEFMVATIQSSKSCVQFATYQKGNSRAVSLVKQVCLPCLACSKMGKGFFSQTKLHAGQMSAQWASKSENTYSQLKTKLVNQKADGVLVTYFWCRNK